MDTDQLAQREDRPLNQEILSILGDEVDDQEYGPPIHQDVANTLIKIVKEGLQCEQQEDLLEKYSIPANCSTLRALKLNPILKQMVRNERVVKRDICVCNLQSQIGSTLTAIGKVITQMLAEGDGRNKQYIERLNDAGCILAHIHFRHTIARRNAFIKMFMKFNKRWRAILATSPIDEWLFGENLNERIKKSNIFQLPHKRLSKKFVKKLESDLKVSNMSQQEMGPNGRYQTGFNNQCSGGGKLSSTKFSENPYNQEKFSPY